MKRKRDYRWASIEKVKLRRHPNEKKGEVFIKIRNKSIFFWPQRERERGRKERKRIRSQAKQETRIINDFCELIWHWEAAARGAGAA